MIDGLDRSARSVLRLEISSLTRKHVDQPREHSGKRLNRESAGLASSPFRRLAVSSGIVSGECLDLGSDRKVFSISRSRSRPRYAHR